MNTNYRKNFRIIRPGQANLVIVLPHNNVSNLSIKLIKFRISHNSSVLILGQKHVISDKFSIMQSNIEQYYSDVMQAIEDYLKLNHTAKIEIIGVSIGSIMLPRLLAESTIKRYDLQTYYICPSDSLVNILFKSNRTKYYRRKYLDQGLSYKIASNKLLKFDSSNYQPQITSKHALLLYSANDGVIPRQFAETLSGYLQKGGHCKTIKISFLGHNLSIIVFWIFWTIKKFRHLKFDSHLFMGD